MSIQNFLKSLTSVPTRRPIRRKPATFRPRFEALEDRCVPATFVVNSPLDHDGLPGIVTLRAAISAANAAPGADQITFDDAVFNAGSTDTIALDLGQLPKVTDQLAIDGSIDGGAARIAIDGKGGSASVTVVKPSRILSNQGPRLDLSNLILKNGRAPSSSTDYGLRYYGGAIYNLTGALNLVNTDVVNSSGAQFGGGLYSANAPVTVTGGTFSGNSAGSGMGGAIFIDQGSLTLTGATIENNTASTQGGGILNSQGTLTIDNTTIRANTIGGTNGGQGGGIHSFGALTINNSTIADNTATVQGGGIWCTGNVGEIRTINNTTITGNTAPSAGGLYASFGTDGSMTITGSTVSDNITGDAGIYFGSRGSLTLKSTIVANSRDSAGAPQKDLARAAFDTATIYADYSLIEKVDNGTINGTTSTSPRKGNVAKSTNLIGVDPMLAPLADNGGPTLTHALLPGSPAINKGLNPLNLPYDQRGPGFSRVVGGAADIGAFEVQPAASTTAGSKSSGDDDTLLAWPTAPEGPSASDPAATTQVAVSEPTTATGDAFFAIEEVNDLEFALASLDEVYLDPIIGEWLADFDLLTELI